jgi:hypothetical protein
MTHQAHFQKTGAILLPVGETLDRNLVLEQYSRLGPTAPLKPLLAPLGFQQPIDGGGALIWINRSRVLASTFSSPCLSKMGTPSGKIAARRLPHK